MSKKEKKHVSNRDNRLESPLDSLDFLLNNGELILEKLSELNEIYLEFSYPQQKIEDNMKIITFAKQQYIIAMISGIEHFFQDLFIDLIDEDLVDIAKLKINIGTEEMVELKKNNISWGETIVKNYNFQNLDVINNVYSKILNINFFEKLREVIRSEHYKKDITYLRLSQNFYPLIQEVIGFRHKCIHDFDLFFDIKMEKLQQYAHEITSFALATGWLLDEYLNVRVKCL